jgi:hypothetical protein
MPNMASEVNVSHPEAAQARIEEIRVMRTMIPELDVPVPPGLRGALGPAGGVPPEFIEAATNSRTNTPELVHGSAVPAEKVRDLVSYAMAYDAVADQLEGLARLIRQRTAEAKNVAGSEALTTYALAKRLAKRPGTRHLAVEVSTMRAALGGKFARKPKPQTTPEPGSGK